MRPALPYRYRAIGEAVMDDVRQREIFRHVALTIMVVAIAFGFVELMGWVKV
jgi:hypothetical protein